MLCVCIIYIMCVYWIYIAYIITVCVWSLSHVRLFATPWTVAHQAPLSTGFPRQEYWSGLPFLFPGDLPNPGIEPESLTAPVLAGTLSLTLSHLGSPIILLNNIIYTHTIHLHTHIYIIWVCLILFICGNLLLFCMQILCWLHALELCSLSLWLIF